jgi:hypothetical protein
VFELNTKIKRKVVSNLVLFFYSFALGWKAQACVFHRILSLGMESTSLCFPKNTKIIQK